MAQFFDQAFIMVVKGHENIRVHRDLFNLVDEWIIGETQFNNFQKVLRLGMGGYQSFPQSETSAPIHIPESVENIWSLSENEFAMMTEPGRVHPVEQISKGRNLNIAMKSDTKEQFVRKLKVPNYMDLTSFSLILKRTAQNGVRKLINLSNDTEFSTLLCWIVRIEFVFLLAVALLSGKGGVARMIQSAFTHEQFQLLIIGCAITGWLLRTASLKNWVIRLKS